uniref:Uncharacterized protein n=1 Tax=Globodera rostochiensis TaxID=31243 RepID=A0A914IBS2_GLORO
MEFTGFHTEIRRQHGFLPKKKQFWTKHAQTINASVEQIGNALISAAANGSETMKKRVDNQNKLFDYRAVMFKSAFEEGSANLTDKTKHYLMNVETEGHGNAFLGHGL